MKSKILAEMSFNDVIHLYKEKLEAERINDIYKRTELLKLYPELFYKETIQEIERTMTYLNRFKNCKKIIKIDFPKKIV